MGWVGRWGWLGAGWLLALAWGGSVAGAWPGWGTERWGTPLVEVRGRVEVGEQETLEESVAMTLRARVGYETPDWSGMRVLAEGEFTQALDGDAYDPYPGPQGTAGKTVIGDPRTNELNRLQVAWKGDPGQVVVGRQRIIRNNARFVGNVGWRQNEQTYDAAAVEAKLGRKGGVYYAYVDGAQRIFGSLADNPAQREWELEGHLVEGQWKEEKWGTAAVYGYLLRFENDPGSSSDTWGGFYQSPARDGWGGKLSGRMEYARQGDNGSSPAGADFGLDYFSLLGSWAGQGLTMEAGWERLGGNGSRGFSTPLATLHAFNGYADVFLATPPAGLDDWYGRVKGAWGPVQWEGVGHFFRTSEDGAAIGWEADAAAVWKWQPWATVIAKLAIFSADSEAPGGYNRDVTRASVEINLKP